MTIAVDIDRAEFAYKDETVIQGISFAVDKGQFFVIIGPNGSGKTTLLKMIGRIAPCKRGRVRLLGRDIRKYSAKTLARTLALVPQTIPVDFPFTVTELVLMGRSPYLGVLGLHGEKDRDIAARAMAFTGVDHLSGKKINQLSGGERQRVFIARAVCQEPEILLLDEPTAALDPSHQITIMDLMKRLTQEKHMTVIMVSHDLNLAAMYGDHLLLMKQGRKVTSGPPGAVIQQDILKETYGCAMWIDDNPVSACPRVTLIPK